MGTTGSKVPACARLVNSHWQFKAVMSKYICRVCAQFIDEPTAYLFCGTEESEEIVRRIHVCSQIMLFDEQSFTSALCDRCLSELNIAYNFRIKCLSSEEKLRELLLIKVTCNENVHEDYTLDDHSDAVDLVSKPETNIAFDVKPDKIYKCAICNKVLKTESSLKKHKESMHERRNHFGTVTGSGASRLYHCTDCNYTTPHSQTLVNHIRTHTGEKPFKCPCGKSFTQSASLIAHNKTHSDRTYFTCFTCGKQFKHLFSLKKHYQVHQEPTFKCSICGKQLKNKDTLNGHMNRHNNVRNYNCEECGDTFCTSSGLINHKKKHKKENVQCHLCSYKTPWKKVLMIHVRRHTGERPFKCDHCEQCCYTKSELAVHQRKHMREKLYSCTMCSQHFVYSSSLNKHMRNIHHSNYKWGQTKHNLLKLGKSTKNKERDS